MIKQLQKEIIASLMDYPEELQKVLSIVPLKEFDEPYQSALSKIEDYQNEPYETIGLHIREVENIPFKDLLDIQSDTSLIFLQQVTNKFKLEVDKRNLRKLINDSKSELELYEALKEQSDLELSKSTTSISRFDKDLEDLYLKLQKEIQSDANPNLMTRNFHKLNEITGGFNTSNIIAIAGIFKSGKTTFAISLMLDYLEQNIPLGFFSLELSKDEILKKIISYQTGIRYSSLRNPKRLSPDESKQLSRYYHQQKKLKRNLFVVSDMLSIYQLKNKMRAMSNAGVKTFFIDYIGYIQSEGGFDNRERELTYFSNFLKRTAKELDITIFIIAQLNRSGKYDASSINLAESVSLARDCDYLFTIAAAENFKDKLKTDYGIANTDNRYLVKLDSSRHSEQGKSFLLEFNSYGMKEVDNSVPNPELYHNYYEPNEVI